MRIFLPLPPLLTSSTPTNLLHPNLSPDSYSITFHQIPCYLVFIFGFLAGCTDCIAGTYSSSNSASCNVCPDGRFSSAGSNACSNCPVGKYSAGVVEGNTATYHADECTQTPAGAYSGIGASAYNYCDSGEYSLAGASSCEECPGGKFLAEGNDNGDADLVHHNSLEKCTNCPAGKKSSSLSGSSICQSCSAGKYSPQGQSQCTDCVAGTWSNSNQADTCIVCSFGKYSDAGSSSCDNCGSGKYLADGKDAITSEDPTPPGTAASLHNSENLCLDCPVDTYSTGVAHTCIPCDVGKSTAQREGAQICTNCQAGQDIDNSCVACVIGEYSHPADSQGRCDPCPAGRYEDYSGFPLPIPPFGVRGSDECDGCPSGKYKSTTGGTSVEQCVVCPGGKFALTTGHAECEICEAGKYSDDGASLCEQCLPGKYSLAGSAGIANCLPCPYGNFSNSLGAGTCEPCSVGKYQDEIGQLTCEDCAENYYAADTGQRICDACPSGKSSTSGEEECYLLESQTNFHTCPTSNVNGVRNKCNYLYAGHWRDLNEGQRNPFGDKCQNFTMVGHDVSKDMISGIKTDEYFLMCAGCVSDPSGIEYHPAGWNTDEHKAEIVDHALHDVTFLNVDGTGATIAAGTKPSLCYTRTQLSHCIETITETFTDPFQERIRCKYLKDGSWSSKEPGEASPWPAGQCSSYTICDFEQSSVKDDYFIMCNECSEGLVPGVTNVNLQQAKGSCSATLTENFNGYPTKCYDADSGFSSCPGDATSYIEYNTDPSHKLEQCKYMYADMWVSRPATDIGENSVDYLSPFGNKCARHELCDVETEEIFGGIFQTTYKLACAECAPGYVPTDPVYRSSTSSLKGCMNYRYPTDCYQPVDLSSPDIDWASCPLGSQGTTIDCYYYHDMEWRMRTSGNSASPWGEGCKKYNYCGRNVTESWESDSYYIMCDECQTNWSPTRIVPPNEYIPNTDCDGQAKQYPAACERNPSPAPTVAATAYPTQPGEVEDDDEEPEIVEEEDTKPARSAAEQLAHFYSGKNSGLAWATTGCAFMGIALAFYKVNKKKGDDDDEYDSDDDSERSSDSSWADYGNPMKKKAYKGKKYDRHDDSDDESTDNDSRL